MPTANPTTSLPQPGVDASKFTLRFWGVRGSVATPGPTTLQYGGNTSCLELRAAGRIIILDAGTGLRLLGRGLMNEFGEQPLDLALLLTHTHWDHIQGLPFFAPVYNPRNQVRVLGYEGARLGLHAVLNGQMEHPFFPIGLPASVTIEETKEFSFNIGPVQVKAARANHPGVCVGYRVSALGRSVTFFPDNELKQAPVGSGKTGKRGAATEDSAHGANASLAEFVRGSDVLIMDTQYDAEEYRHHMGWGHGCMEEVVSFAMAAQVKELFLFHHDPDHNDEKIAQMVAAGRKLVAQNKGELQVEAAREGLVVELTKS